MSRSASVSVPRRELYVVPERRTSLELEDAPRLMHDQQREYDSWPCDSFFLLPDAVLTMDAGTFRADLMSLDPALSASLPDWDLPGLTGRSASPARESSHKPRSPHAHVASRADRRSLTLLDHHEGLTVHTAGQGTVLIGGGGDGRDSSGGAGGSAPSANGHSGQQQQQQQDQQQNSAAASKKSPAKKGPAFSLVASDIDIGEGEPAPAQRERFLTAGDAPHGLPPVPPARGRSSAPADQDAYWFAQGDNPPPSKQQRASLAGPNDLIFGEDDKSSGLSYKDREERVRQLREKQQLEKQQKLEELKEQGHQSKAAAAQKFREQQENERRRRLEDMRLRDADRRSQVEERKRIIQQAEQDRREAVLRKTAEREQRLESKRRNEKSNIVFAFGSSTPRMLDPKDSASTFWGSRRATSTTNVHLADTNISRRASEGGDMDLSRKRATSAHSLDRKPEGEDLMTRSMTAAIPASAARRRTDLMPAMPSLRDSSGSTRSSPRHRSPVSVGSTSSTKPARAKSAGSDRSAPATPARTPVKATTPKKTPSQVKAENAAKKAVEKSKSTPKTKTTPKTTPLHSPAVESKPLPGSKEKRASPQKEDKPAEQNNKETKQQKTETDATAEVKPDTADASQEAPVPAPVEESQPEKVAEPTAEPAAEPIVNDTDAKLQPTEEPTPTKPQESIAKEPENNETPKAKEKEGSQENLEKTEESEKTMIKKAADKPVTGYATEEDYKAALAEKRRQAREAKERELELERQKQLAEEERERREEQEYLKMIEEQKKAEEERLRKAIEEADRQREEEAKKKEEEEKQREENERIEQQKRLEAEEKLRREEEERQARKSRVAAIMARTRGKGGSNTPTKAEAKTPSDETKAFNEADMSGSMTDSMINALVSQSESSSQPQSDMSSQPDQPSSDASSRPSQPGAGSVSENAVVAGVETDSKTPAVKSATPPSDVTSASMGVELTHSNVEVTRATENSMVDDLISGIASVKVEEPHVNGDSPVPMDTTPTQSVDLLGTISDVHSVNHNGVDNTPAQTSQGTDNLLGSLDPINSSNNTTAVTPAAANFEQIIDLGQTKLSNEDAVNSNPPSPFIAFEQNLNKKQSQDNTSTVPDLLL
ncbi:ensconsin isoform X39 [Penaeus vannamei]|uniref:ensconsin isoform X39 n=1 Tax=Penaeus vannamei TaxID=6689 RepID=UPI00387FAC1E